MRRRRKNITGTGQRMRHKKKNVGRKCKDRQRGYLLSSFKNKTKQRHVMNSFVISSCCVCFPTGACEIRHSSSELTRHLDAGPCKGALHSTGELQGGCECRGRWSFFFFFPEQAIAYSIHNQAASYILFTKIIFLPRWRTGWRRRATGS